MSSRRHDSPGNDGYTDVVQIFRNAAAVMNPGQMVFMDGFTLEDAMSVFEIGEPRLDSGFIPPGEVQRVFNPLQPLTPEEVCWVLDRSFSCEMEWHSGNMLAQTVFTFLYVHHLSEIETDCLPTQAYDSEESFLRPMELLTVVVRAAVLGLLKCVDLSWRELSKGQVQDGEDWQGDKCDVSLLEGASVKQCLWHLDEAMNWVSSTHRIPVHWRNALSSRLLLRKYLLQMMDANLYRHPPQFKSLVALCREQLRIVESLPSSTPPPESPAHAVFDPAVSRRLNTFMPIRVHELPTQERTWNTLSMLIDGWADIYRLSVTTDISSWEIDGNLSLWLPNIPAKLPYIRSYTQTIFYDGVLVLNRFTPIWLVNRFFLEILGVSYDIFTTNVKQRWTRQRPPLLGKLETQFSELLTSHIKGHWYNAPRKRRHLMKSLPAWHAIFDQIQSITSRLEPAKIPGQESNRLSGNIPGMYDQIVDNAACAVLMWRMAIVREVVLSGFQLQLYSRNEVAVAYWYLIRVFDTILNCIDRLRSISSLDPVVRNELNFIHALQTAGQLSVIALFSVTIVTPTVPESSQRSSFQLRYKWAYSPSYKDSYSPLVAPPQFEDYKTDAASILADTGFSPAGCIQHAKMIFQQLLDQGNTGGWAGHARSRRLALLKILHDNTASLLALPANMEEVQSFDQGLLKWDTSKHPWFPVLCEEGKDSRRGKNLPDVQTTSGATPVQ